MKKIFLKAYLNNNLGDDLFVDIITKRYPNTEFHMFAYKSVDTQFNENVKLHNSKTDKLINKSIKAITLNKTNLESIYMKKCDATVLIGGSMFIEKRHKKLDSKLKDNKFYIIGTNFGPYETNEFKEYYTDLFGHAQDVCFREKNSYDLFANLKNVRYTCDIVFGLKLDETEIKDDKNVVISVIDCDKKGEPKNKEQYEKLILELIRMFANLDYKITLMSFCKNEGDEDAIKTITDKITDNTIKEKINQYNYNGNIEEALNVLQKSSIIVGSRFHANVLGLVMNKAILPIAYSDKTINTLNDIGYKGKVIDIRKLEQFEIDQLTKEDLTYKLNIDDFRSKSEEHFKQLDKFLKEE